MCMYNGLYVAKNSRIKGYINTRVNICQMCMYNGLYVAKNSRIKGYINTRVNMCQICIYTMVYMWHKTVGLNKQIKQYFAFRTL